MRDNVKLLNETLEAVQRGHYTVDGERVSLPLGPAEYERAIYLSPEAVAAVEVGSADLPADASGAVIEVSNRGSFEAARAMRRTLAGQDDVLVLNFASPVNPGGGVRNGAMAQEEDLCRKSSLLLSLESEAARPFYELHRERCGRALSSDAMILSPAVEVLRDGRQELLSRPALVSVVTCAAPVKTSNAAEDLGEDAYGELLYRRIEGLLRVAAHYGYRHLVLGAWGCGVFGNDARQVARLFHEALDARIDGDHRLSDCFRAITFAILSPHSNGYNYIAFDNEFD